MANETRRLSPAVLTADQAALAALKDISGYTPANADYTLAKVTAAFDAMDAEQEIETQKQAAADAARDDATAAEWAFHNAILGVKEQVRAQYGMDSNELQSIGLTKKSEKAKPAFKTKPAPAAAA
jgi:hypothetical protein